MICTLCPHHCDIQPGQTGFCRGRANIEGKISCINYGKLTAMALDTIEKKPLRRFLPGSVILSVGSFGCNLCCPFCQNHDISMADRHIKTFDMAPEQLILEAKKLESQGNIGIAFTYNEPLIGYEYVRDCAKLAHTAGLKVVLVTNGMIEAAPLQELLPDIDAMNIDLKGFTPEFYKQICGNLDCVKQTISIAAQACHVEVTTLVIPGENDQEDLMIAEAKWLAAIDPAIPLHISRFFPRYKMTDKKPTPIAAIYHLRDIAAQDLKYVYTGNV